MPTPHRQLLGFVAANVRLPRFVTWASPGNKDSARRAFPSHRRALAQWSRFAADRAPCPRRSAGFPRFGRSNPPKDVAVLILSRFASGTLYSDGARLAAVRFAPVRTPPFAIRRGVGKQTVLRAEHAIIVCLSLESTHKSHASHKCPLRQQERRIRPY